MDQSVELLGNGTCSLRVFLAVKKIIVHEKDAFLLSNLLEDIKRSSELSRLTEPIISNTRTLKGRIIDKFSDDISFYRKDKYLIVNSSDVNLYEYLLAILKRKGLKACDIMKLFGELIWRKIKITTGEKQSPEWSYSRQETVEMLIKGPLLQIYNRIFYSVHEKNVTNKYGYAKTEFSQFGAKICSMA